MERCIPFVVLREQILSGAIWLLFLELGQLKAELDVLDGLLVLVERFRCTLVVLAEGVADQFPVDQGRLLFLLLGDRRVAQVSTEDVQEVEMATVSVQVRLSDEAATTSSGLRSPRIEAELRVMPLFFVLSRHIILSNVVLFALLAVDARELVRENSVLDFRGLASSPISEALRVVIAAPSRECYPRIGTPDVSDQVFRAATATHYDGEVLLGRRERTSILSLRLGQRAGFLWFRERVGLLWQRQRVRRSLPTTDASRPLALSIHLLRSLPMCDLCRLANHARAKLFHLCFVFH